MVIQSIFPLGDKITAVHVPIVQVCQVETIRNLKGEIQISRHPEISVVPQIPDSCIAPRILPADLFRVVAGAIIADDELEIRERLG